MTRIQINTHCVFCGLPTGQEPVPVIGDTFTVYVHRECTELQVFSSPPGSLPDAAVQRALVQVIQQSPIFR